MKILGVIFGVIEYTRYRIDYLNVWIKWFINNKKPKPISVVFFSDGRDYISERQYSPFYFYRKSLRDKLGFVFLPKKLIREALPLKGSLNGYNIIIYKIHYKTEPHEIPLITTAILEAAKKAHIIYFDGRDDLGVQFPELLDQSHLYVKRHCFKNRMDYTKEYFGGISLTDYIYKHIGREALGAHGKSIGVEIKKLFKIHCGMSYGMDSILLKLQHRHHTIDWCKDRPWDVICRMTIPNSWLYYLRAPVVPILKKIQQDGRFVLLPDRRVSQREYYNEMLQSKICVSPFGYGDVCIRDYEAAALGCLLIKPDMKHVEAKPNIFQPFKTYIPVSWDYSDLEEKIQYYLSHDQERIAIARNAKMAISECSNSKWFLNEVKSMLVKVDHLM